MLVVSRKLGESVQIGDGVQIAIVEIKGSKVRIGISADKSTEVVRAEIAPESEQRRFASHRRVA